MQRLPSTVALTCFVKAARSLSVTQAAKELCLTQSAVSRQIKSLEDSVGLKLFLRQKQRLALSKQGLDYYNEVAPLLTQLEKVTSRLKEDFSHKSLVIGADSSFASHWLLPRLESFTQQRSYRFELLSDEDQLYQQQIGFDIGILYGDGSWSGFDCIKLMQSQIVAVCSPELVESFGCIKVWGDILNYPILHHQMPVYLQERLSTSYLWLNKAGLSNSQISQLPGARFKHFRFMLDAALVGSGVAMLPDFYVAKEIQEGRLVVASSNKLSCGDYYLVVRKGQVKNPKIKEIKSWLLKGSDSKA